MKPEDINRKVAEALGRNSCDKWIPAFHVLMGVQKNCNCKDCYPVCFGPPKYTENLDLCFKMEESLKEPEDLLQYEYWLKTGNQSIWHASAPEKCEAFLKVKKLWEP